MKYIDAEQIRAEIERQRYAIDGLFEEGDNSFYDGQDDAWNHTLAFIDALPEQPVEETPEPYTGIYDEAYLQDKIARATKSWEGVDTDKMLVELRGYEQLSSEGLEEEIEMEWDSFNKHLAEYDDGADEVVWLNLNSFEDIARHFAEWGAEHLKR